MSIKEKQEYTTTILKDLSLLDEEKTEPLLKAMGKSLYALNGDDCLGILDEEYLYNYLDEAIMYLENWKKG